MKNFPKLGIQIPDLLLPAKSIDLRKWAVIACDQFTAQPEYWQQVAEQVGDSPSTLHMIFPEVMLGKPGEENRIAAVQQKMNDYLKQGTLVDYTGMIYVERTCGDKTRRGLMVALDLEHYDFNRGSTSLIRATEGTILDRLPPRIKIRQNAMLELPHILVLIDDPDDLVLGSIEKQKQTLGIAYDFDLMQSSGHLSGRYVDHPALQEEVVRNLNQLNDPAVFQKKYNVGTEVPVLLYAVGDGNHSLATAKSIWEKLKPTVGMDHPARYALVEIENVHDRALEFEPIHRLLFNLKSDPKTAMQSYFGSRLDVLPADSMQTMMSQVQQSPTNEHRFGFITAQGINVVKITNPKSNLAVGTLQEFLDAWLKTGEVGEIDYVHGDETICELGAKKECVGFYLAGMSKSELFKTVILDGSLPRKTFSMGNAHEKRFYFEARRILKS